MDLVSLIRDYGIQLLLSLTVGALGLAINYLMRINTQLGHISAMTMTMSRTVLAHSQAILELTNRTGRLEGCAGNNGFKHRYSQEQNDILPFPLQVAEASCDVDDTN